MDLTPIAGNIPAWISAGLAGYSLKKSSRAEQFFLELQAAGLDAKKIADAVSQAERFGDLLEDATEVALRSTDGDRRTILARAYAAGIEGGLAIDDLQFFIRTMREVDPIHMKLLRAIQQRGSVSDQQLLVAWPEAASMLKPMRALLDREGLIEDVSLGISTSYATGSWSITDYGHRFLTFVMECPTAIDWLPAPSF